MRQEFCRSCKNFSATLPGLRERDNDVHQQRLQHKVVAHLCVCACLAVKHNRAHPVETSSSNISAATADPSDVNTATKVREDIVSSGPCCYCGLRIHCAELRRRCTKLPPAAPSRQQPAGRPAAPDGFPSASLLRPRPNHLLLSG